MSTSGANPVGTFTPLPWRVVTPLHKQLGARSLRFVYVAGGALPIIGVNPQSIVMRYGPETGIDRLVGFSVMLGKGADAPELTIAELATGWTFDHVFTANQGASLWGNLESLPDEVNLTFSWAAATSRNVYMSFFNFEVVPALY